MNRAQRRRQQRLEAKGILDSAPTQRIIPKVIVTNDGTRYSSVEEWLKACELEAGERAARTCNAIASELLYKTEIFMSVRNILTMLVAMEKTVGNLKTVQKSYQKIIDRFNEATEYIDKIGVRECYEEFHRKYGLEMEFDEVDLDWVDDDGKEVYERFKLRIGAGKEGTERKHSE